MPTFDDARLGDRWETGARLLTQEDVDTLTRTAGYVHPLFTDPAAATRAGFTATPVPGQLVLALLAGLAEASGRIDDTVIALVGLDRVRFLRPVTADTTLHLVAEVVHREPKGDRGLLTYQWKGVCDGEVAVEAETTFLFRRA